MKRRNLAWDYAWTATEPAAGGTVRVGPHADGTVRVGPHADGIENRDTCTGTPTPAILVRMRAGARHTEQYAPQNRHLRIPSRGCAVPLTGAAADPGPGPRGPPAEDRDPRLPRPFRLSCAPPPLGGAGGDPSCLLPPGGTLRHAGRSRGRAGRMYTVDGERC